MDMMMGMSLGDAASSTMQRAYWTVIGVAVALWTTGNVLNKVLYRQRIAASRNGASTPAKPKSLFWKWTATVSALYGETSSASASISFSLGRRWTLQLPTLGRTILVLANIAVLLVLCFYGFDPSDYSQFELIGYRVGWINVAQLPLLFLLAGKNNIIGWLTGVSYEKLNWLHRWTARCLFLTATIHMGYWFADWARYDYIVQNIKTDTITQKGLAAWAILAWIVFSSFAPIRGWSYEFFVIQHLISFAGFIGAAYIHTPSYVHVWFWIPIGLFFFDRVVRALLAAYTNLSFFHPKQRREGQTSDFWACKADFVPQSNGITRITIMNPPIRWAAGQHMFLSCHSILPLQSHPFTIASIPEDGKMEFFVKAEKGGTRRLLNFAERHQGLPTSATKHAVGERKSVAIEGPYGRLRPLRQFDSVVFFAGSTGATFTVPLLRDIVLSYNALSGSQAAKKTTLGAGLGLVTRHIRFVWIIKSKDQLSWFSSQLAAAIEDVKEFGRQGNTLEIDMSIYITCDDSFTSSTNLNDNPDHLFSSKSTPARTSMHGRVEKMSKLAGTPLNEKLAEKADEERPIAIREASSADSMSSSLSVEEGKWPSTPTGCSPDGTCCCRNTVEDEDAISPASATAGCTCNCKTSAPLRPESASSSNSSTLVNNKPALPLLHPSIMVFSGRPQPRNVIRKSLEQALGESAVVVCGPKGLVRDVRQSVVALSDERAVHKGTGAQGIYLHVESFGY